MEGIGSGQLYTCNKKIGGHSFNTVKFFVHFLNCNVFLNHSDDFILQSSSRRSCSADGQSRICEEGDQAATCVMQASWKFGRN